MSSQQILKSIKIMLVVATLVGIGGLIFATSSSCVSQGQNGSTICKPLTDGTANEVKNGGLSVGSFIARSGSSITGPTYVSGNLTVAGNNTANGTVIAESLIGTGIRNVCADSSGKLFICGTAPAAKPCTVTSGSQTFTTSGSWTVPSTICPGQKITFTAYGAGGGGGGGQGSKPVITAGGYYNGYNTTYTNTLGFSDGARGGSGGNGGSSSMSSTNLTSGTVITYNVGTGGAGSAGTSGCVNYSQSCTTTGVGGTSGGGCGYGTGCGGGVSTSQTCTYSLSGTCSNNSTKATDGTSTTVTGTGINLTAPGGVGGSGSNNGAIGGDGLGSAGGTGGAGGTGSGGSGSSGTQGTVGSVTISW